MSRIFENRSTFQFGIENEELNKLQKRARKLKIHPGWIVNQMVELFNEKPEVLFEHLTSKIKRNGL